MTTVASEPATIFLTRSSEASVWERSVLNAGPFRGGVRVLSVADFVFLTFALPSVNVPVGTDCDERVPTELRPA
jgi:hypothetical protein